jgi:hypothetical protein
MVNLAAYHFGGTVPKQKWQWSVSIDRHNALCKMRQRILPLV